MKLSTIRPATLLLAAAMLFSQFAGAAALNIGNAPLYLSSSVPPLVMLTISKDHTLFSKAYNDYTDLDGDGIVDTTYKHGIDYAGYFDSYKCYSYDIVNNVFVPTNWTAKDKTQAASAAVNLTAKYCNTGSATAPSGAKATNTWSGNFLNWASMARIDAMRFVLYGGTRSTDTAASTILERAYIPTEAHSWSKYYNGADISSLTPFNPATTQPASAAAGGGGAIGTGSINVRTGASVSALLGDQVVVSKNSSPATIYMVGTVISVTSGSNFNIQVVAGDTLGAGTPDNTWTVTNLSRTGISFCNTTTSATTYSQNVVTANDPPRIRATQGNYALWSANERWQCRFYEEKSNTNGGNTGYANSNGNRALQSQLNASAENPSNSCASTGLCVAGKANPDYYARVQACVGVVSGNNLNGEEKCKQYPGGNYKPIGLLQTYGDGNLIQFGLLTGSYDHNISGGVLRKNISTFQDEVNTATDGTFTAASASGIVGNLNKLRLWGYNHGSGVYNDSTASGGDSCVFQLIEQVISGGNGTDTVNEGNCSNWGNPMSEMYLESLRYFTGKAPFTVSGTRTIGSTALTAIADTSLFVVGAPISGTGIPAGATIVSKTVSTVTMSASATSTGAAMTISSTQMDPRFNGPGNNSPSKDASLGLTAAVWTDPVGLANYCAPMNVMMFNPAISSYDDTTTDQMSRFSDLVTGSPAAPFNQTMDQMTKQVGDVEGITGNTFFVGNAPGQPAGTGDSCVPKTVTDLSQINGMCPEGPQINGSYRMVGAAWYAHMNRIRPTFVGGSTGVAPPVSDKRSLKVTTYAVQLATNTPKVVVPIPGSASQKVIIQPTYRLDKGAGKFGGGTLVDFKIVAQDLVAGTGTFYINYEDSGFGGDYDQDVWGRLSYCVKTATTTCPLVNGAVSIPDGTITITQDIIAQSTGNPQGWGFIVSGTTQDGMHFFSGILGLNYNTSTARPPLGDPNRNINGGASVPLDSTGVLGCNNCLVADPAKSWIFTLSATSNAGILLDPLFYAAKWGGFTDLNGSNTPDQASEFDIFRSDGTAGSDGVPDNYYFVTNPLQLEQALDRAFIAILTTSSASSVATNTTKLQAGATVYQAKFNSNDWSGQLLALSIDTAGNVNQTTPVWDASTLLPAWSSRNIITYNNSKTDGTNDGVPFRYCAQGATGCSGINDAVQRAALNTDASGVSDGAAGGIVCTSMGTPVSCVLKGDLRLQYLRGNQINEGAASGLFRRRPNTVLGDIVNSTPNFVGAPPEFFFDAAFITFRNANVGRKPVIYVGGNDGMLHAFDATPGPTTQGKELLAYVPSETYRNLTKLTGQTYTNTASHVYFADGNPTVASAFIDPTTGGAGTPTRSWNSVLVGSMNAGGKGLYALNVTNPATFAESNAASIVLWEFTNKDDPDLGYTFSTPVIAKMANGKWAAIVGNGYNNSTARSGETACVTRKSLYVQTATAASVPLSSTPVTPCQASADGHSSIFIIFLEGGTDGVWTAGTDYIKIDTGIGSAGTPAGLSSPFALDYDGDDIIDYIYAGDLQGNMWKFDVTSATPSSWAIAFPSSAGYPNGSPLFTAKDTAATPNAQPIQDAPQVTVHPAGGQLVLFGTGKYLEPGDDVPSAAAPYRQQSFYSIWDQQTKTVAGTPVSSRSTLMPQSIYCSGTLGGGAAFVDPTQTCSISVPGVTNQFRLTTQHNPNYTAANRTDTVVDPSITATSPGPLASGTFTVTPERGWFLDFPNSADQVSPSYANTGTGERVIYRPGLITGKIVFATLIPSNISCELGGTGFIFDLDPVTGSRLSASPIDVNNDGSLNQADLLTLAGTSLAVSAQKSGLGIPTAPTVIGGASASSVSAAVTAANVAAAAANKAAAAAAAAAAAGTGTVAAATAAAAAAAAANAAAAAAAAAAAIACGVGCEIKVISTSSGQVLTIRERAGATGAARISWRELIQD